jgi:hypothetical protein
MAPKVPNMVQDNPRKVQDSRKRPCATPRLLQGSPKEPGITQDSPKLALEWHKYGRVTSLPQRERERERERYVYIYIYIERERLNIVSPSKVTNEPNLTCVSDAQGIHNFNGC